MRKGAKNYSLESLSSDPEVMRPSVPVSLCREVQRELGTLELQSKTKMKEIFGRERMKRDGTPAKVGHRALGPAAPGAAATDASAGIHLLGADNVAGSLQCTGHGAGRDAPTLL